jgi:hypothetical protein
VPADMVFVGLQPTDNAIWSISVELLLTLTRGIVYFIPSLKEMPFESDSEQSSTELRQASRVSSLGCADVPMLSLLARAWRPNLVTRRSRGILMGAAESVDRHRFTVSLCHCPAVPSPEEAK